MLGAVALYLALNGSPALAGASIQIDAVVLSVDKSRRIATVRYAALDTAPGGTRVVGVADAAALKTMWVGESIHAIADTSRTPWILSHVVKAR
jgi:Asp/Glu/hydantoin racemase